MHSSSPASNPQSRVVESASKIDFILTHPLFNVERRRHHRHLLHSLNAGQGPRKIFNNLQEEVCCVSRLYGISKQYLPDKAGTVPVSNNLSRHAVVVNEKARVERDFLLDIYTPVVCSIPPVAVKKSISNV